MSGMLSCLREQTGLVTMLCIQQTDSVHNALFLSLTVLLLMVGRD